MSTRPEINMEAFFDADSDAKTFDDPVDDEYTGDLAFEAEDSIGEENDATEKLEEDENQSKTSMLPIAASILRAGPRAQDDQEILFRELMRDHQKRLYRFVIRYIDHPDDAADITQQAFAEAARTISSFRGDSKLSTWLYGIAMNMVRNYMRKLIEQDLYELPVLSYQELTPEVNIQPLARVEI
jgi:Sigma-70 region 2